MHSFLGLLLCTFSFIVPTQAQLSPVAESLLGSPLAASSQDAVMLLGETRLAYRIHVFSREDDLTKYLKTWTKQHLGSEGKKVSGFHHHEPVLRANWTTDTLAFYYKTEKSGDFSQFVFTLQRNQRFVSDSSDSDILPVIRRDIESAVNTFYLQIYDAQIADLQKACDVQQKDVGRVDKRQAKLKSEINNHRNGAEKARNKEDVAINQIGKAENTIKSLEGKKDQQAKDLARTDKDVLSMEEQIRAKQLEYEGYNKVGELNTKRAVRVEKDLEKLRGNEAKLQAKHTKQSDALAKIEKSIIKAEGDKRKAEKQRDDNIRSRENHDRQRSKLEQDLKDLDQTMKQEIKDVETARQYLEKMKNARAAFANRAFGN